MRPLGGIIFGKIGDKVGRKSRLNDNNHFDGLFLHY